MILKIDNYISRIFFTKNVIIVEGDTEDILIKESLRRLEKLTYLKILADFEVIKARGKATIISLIKYLKSLGINPIVVHDLDLNEPNAVKYNEPISVAMEGNGKLITMNNCVEDEIGYTASNEKPFKAFKQTEQWTEDWNSLPLNWRNKMVEIFTPYI